MNSKKIILGLIVLLIIGVCIFSFSNNLLDTTNIINYSFNSTNNLTNGNYITNNSLTNNSSDVEDSNLDSLFNSYSKNHANSNNNKKEKVKDEEEFTAEDAMKDVENNVLFSGFKYEKGVKANVGYPEFKDEMGDWLVPGYDKKTGEYLGSVYVGKKGGPYFHGPETYKDYKEVISKNK